MDAIPKASMGTTLEQHFQSLHPDVLRDDSARILKWPPDVFALAAHVLKLTGSYLEVLKNGWPDPSLATPEGRWDLRCPDIGAAWRTAVVSETAIPDIVQAWWNTVRMSADTTLDAIASSQTEPLVLALISLVAAADEACEGVGGLEMHQGRDAAHNKFLFRARMLLETQGISGQSSLSTIPNPQLIVLPKRHTPQSGITLRSLTHHLALVQGLEVSPRYWSLPFPTPVEPSFQVLLAPWPLQISPASFKPHPGNLHEMPPRFRFVDVDRPSQPEAVGTYLRNLITHAKRFNPQLHLVVFPELSLTESEWGQVARIVAEASLSVIAGVRCPQSKEPGQPFANQVRYQVSQAGKSAHPSEQGPTRKVLIEHAQNKHHRWLLDANQIRMYGLGGTLDVNHAYWEYIALEPRRLNFTSISRDLMFCCLICEDLARQDPVAEILRAVGPNLVLALLMDGPQLQMRWPARYATVLAEDPGCSVLTFTCAGMVDLTTPPPGAARRRTVGLWKEAGSTEFKELDLPQDAHGLLLSLTCVHTTEYTADGRSDGGVASNPRLTAVHAISCRPTGDPCAV